MNITPVSLYHDPPLKCIAFLPAKSLLFLVPIFLLLIACQNPVSPGPPGPGPGPSGSHASGYTVTFNSNDGTDTVFAVKTVTSPATTIGATDFPENPDRADYIFGGWNTDSGGTGTGFNASTTVSASITVYAQWTAEPQPGSYAVTFALNDGTPNVHAIKTVTGPETTIDALPDPPNRTGYDFGGWNTDSGGTGTTFDTSTTVTASITVYAKWHTYSYTVTFDKNGGETGASPATKTVASPATHLDALPNPPGWSGYKFMGWNTDMGGTGYAFNASTTVSGNITVFAQWTATGGSPISDGKGSLSYSITVPSTGIRGFLGLYPVDAPGLREAIPEILFTSSDSGIITDIPEGKYRAVIDLYDGDNNKAADWTEENIEIHQGATATFTKNFNPGDFALCPGLVGENETTLAAKLDAALASSGSYTIVLDGTETDLGSFTAKTLRITGNKNISVTLRGNGNMVQSGGGTGRLLTLETVSSSSLKLVLHDITLKAGAAGNPNIKVEDAGGTLEMKAGSHITGTTGNSGSFIGAGVYVFGGTFTMSGGTVSGNTASYDRGGGVCVDGTGTFNMSGGAVSNNITTRSGGGVYVSGTFNMSGGVVSGNTASNAIGGGGGVYVHGTFNMNGGVVSDNLAVDCGGGVYVYSGIFTMNGGAVSGNTADDVFDGGGGVYVTDNGIFTMSGGTVSDNTAHGGGGVYVTCETYESAAFNMGGGAVSGNRSKSDGGGIYITKGAFDMSGGVVSGNTTPNNGGGVYIYNGYGGFTKTGGIIYGYDAGDPDNPNWNICKTSAGVIRDKFGHAAYYYSSPGYYRDLTLNAGDNISTTNLPTGSGAGNSNGTNWIKK